MLEFAEGFANAAMTATLHLAARTASDPRRRGLAGGSQA
jgi:hypothetical protein